MWTDLDDDDNNNNAVVMVAIYANKAWPTGNRKCFEMSPLS